VAEKALKQGLPGPDIADITGLSLAQIENQKI